MLAVGGEKKVKGEIKASTVFVWKKKQLFRHEAPELDIIRNAEHPQRCHELAEARPLLLANVSHF